MKGKMPWEHMKRQVFVRREAKTNQKFGGDPKARTTDEIIKYGVINIDKPKGPTSHQVSAYLQKIIGVNKAGHSGTLDPSVTGCLPTAVGNGTRIVQALLIAGKEYICLMHVHQPIDNEKVEEVLQSFVGKIKQLPPIKSAVKRQWRYRKIYYIETLDVMEQDILFRVGCQAGTYIRKLCHDMGTALGCGAHMAELRRTKAGPFNESTLVTLNDLTDAMWYYKNEQKDTYLRKIIQPIENAVAHLPKVWVLDTAVNALCHGSDLKVPGISKVESDIQVDEMIAIMTLKGELVAIGITKMISNEMVKSPKGIAVRTSKVFMEPRTYPKVEKIE